MIKKSNIRYIILIIAVITGFTCVFTTVVQGESTTLVLEAEGVEVDAKSLEQWWEGTVLHIRYYTKRELSGTIGGIAFTGHNEIYTHVKIDFATGELIANGKVTWYITLNGRVGTFYGPVNTKGVFMGDQSSKIALQGAEGFDGWKLFGIVRNLPGADPPKVIFSGTVLIPQYDN
ncbi:MAG: hypothetical protein ACFE9I_17900 [Candidatus Hermodarchaeota archaeon]